MTFDEFGFFCFIFSQKKGENIMKKKFVLTMLGLLILSFFTIPAFAGVEPTPWHAQVNRLNAVMNGLDSINRRLEDVLPPPDPFKLRMPAPEGVMGRLEAMADQLNLLDDKITAAMSGVPLKPEPVAIKTVLMDINRSAMETARMARIGIGDTNEGVSNAFAKVQTAAEMITATVKDWMMNPIDVIRPYNESICVIGYPCNIAWDTSNIQGYNMVWLEVVYPDVSECCGPYPVPNTGNYVWEPDPSWADPGVLCQPFRIKVYTNDDVYWGVSGLFKVGVTSPLVCTW